MTEHCPICDAPGQRVSERRELKLGRRSAEVEHELYRCPQCGEAWYTPDQMDRAQALAADEIRRAEGLLAPEEIRGIREALDLSQADFERLLGFGPKTVGRWERGTVIANSSSDLLMRVVGSFPEVVRLLALKSGVELPESLEPTLRRDAEWRAAVRERLASYRAGETRAIPAEEVFQKLRDRSGERGADTGRT